jgi:hypothetical protein
MPDDPTTMTPADLARAIREGRLGPGDLTAAQRAAAAAELRRQAQGAAEHADELRQYQPPAS